MEQNTKYDYLTFLESALKLTNEHLQLEVLFQQAIIYCWAQVTGSGMEVGKRWGKGRTKKMQTQKIIQDGIRRGDEAWGSCIVGNNAGKIIYILLIQPVIQQVCQPIGKPAASCILGGPIGSAIGCIVYTQIQFDEILFPVIGNVFSS